MDFLNLFQFNINRFLDYDFIYFYCILSLFGLIRFFITQKDRYIIMIESPIKKKVFSKKPLFYEDAIESIYQLKHQLKCQNAYGFKKPYNIYLLKYNKLNPIKIDC